MTEDCNCFPGRHHDECEHFDFKRGYINLKNDIEQLDKLIDDGFVIEMGKSGNPDAGAYMIRARHPNQIEEAECYSILSGIVELADWVSECAVME